MAIDCGEKFKEMMVRSKPYIFSIISPPDDNPDEVKTDTVKLYTIGSDKIFNKNRYILNTKPNPLNFEYGFEDKYIFEIIVKFDDIITILPNDFTEINIDYINSLDNSELEELLIYNNLISVKIVREPILS